jgi:hypothetical protein
MNKAEKIVEFIRANKPRRKELVRFIVVDLNKKLTSKEWDALPSYDSTRSYYATNISKWKRQGNIVVDEKTKRYSMSKYYNGNLYGITSKVQIEMLEQRSNHWKNIFIQAKTQNEVLRAENQMLQEKLEEIKEIII